MLENNDPSFGLQWGRGSSSAETALLAAAPSRQPRFNGAADLHPRKLGRSSWIGSSWKRFNGAADLHPRKPDIHDKLSLTRRASMGPRIFIRGNHDGEAAREAGVWLQWGRGSSSAETCMNSPPRTVPGRLQWGRGSSSAETARCNSGPSIGACFNGAADLHPRKPARQPGGRRSYAASMGPRIFIRGNSEAAATPGVHSYASMGPRIFIRGNPGCPSGRSPDRPRFNGAADLHPRKRQVTVHAQGGARASMGPRIFIRGNFEGPQTLARFLGTLQWGRGSSSAETLAPRFSAASRVELQWGRGSSSAETPSLAACRTHSRCFNGAADLHPRKHGRAPAVLATLPDASMGPRIFIRGNVRRGGGSS